MIRIRKLLAQEWDFLLAQLGAPDARTLLRRTLFWLWLYAGTGTVLGGLVAVYNLFGMSAFLVAAAGVLLFSMWVIARTGGGGGADPEMYEWMGVTPPGEPQLPPAGTPQVGQASTAIAPSRRGPACRTPIAASSRPAARRASDRASGPAAERSIICSVSGVAGMAPTAHATVVVHQRGRQLIPRYLPWPSP